MGNVAHIEKFLSLIHPYDSLSPDQLTQVASFFEIYNLSAGNEVYAYGQPLQGLYVIQQGAIEVTDRTGEIVSLLGPRNSFGERGLMRDGLAATTATVTSDAILFLLPEKNFHLLIRTHESFRTFFNRSQNTQRSFITDLNTSLVSTLMTPRPVTCSVDALIKDVASIMHDKHISCVCVLESDELVGIITSRDIVSRVVAAGLNVESAISEVMSPNPFSLSPKALGSEVLHIMFERGIGHLPIVDHGKLVGIITQTDLTHFQALSSASMVRDISQASDVETLKKITNALPILLVQLVSAGNRHEVVTRLITDIADACTRRLLKLAEHKFGRAPVPWLWLACGSQGRQEQTGVSDQDNCLILSDQVQDHHRPYFKKMAQFVSDGLHLCGYVYCPGDMMATNDQWCQPLHVWRQYFKGWIDKPDPMAQMLASVMYDLRPIGGDESLFDNLQQQTLAQSARNSIFMAHMVSNSLKNTPPLGLLSGLATIRSGEYKNSLDMKHNGVVPVVDLGRIYALQGQLTPVNTRARLEAAMEAGVLSASGGVDLLAAYDHIADARLNHQVQLIRQNRAANNFLSPALLSNFQRSHLRDAFVVIKSMQSALGHGRAAPT